MRDYLLVRYSALFAGNQIAPVLPAKAPFRLCLVFIRVVNNYSACPTANIAIDIHMIHVRTAVCTGGIELVVCFATAGKVLVLTGCPFLLVYSIT
jgi:hypothetical protein